MPTSIPHAHIANGDTLEHHPDGSVTLTPDEAGRSRALLDSVMAGQLDAIKVGDRWAVLRSAVEAEPAARRPAGVVIYQ